MIMKPIRLMIADDHPLMSEGIFHFLNEEPDITVTATACCGEDALSLLGEGATDVLLMEVRLPGAGGVEFCRDIRRINTMVKILGLGNTPERSSIMRMMYNGASGYLLKSVPVSELISAIRIVAEGGVYFNKAAQQLLSRHEEEELAELPSLTAREREVLHHIAEGFTSAQIATKLFISRLTVETHRRSLIRKLKVNNAAALMRVAAEWGLLK